VTNPLRAARSRQLARLPQGRKRPAPRAAWRWPNARPIRPRRDAPATLRAYVADLAHFKAWCAHGEPARRSAALTTPAIRRLVEGCGDDLAALRDRALLLIGFAGALRRSELVGIDAAHVRSTPAGLRLMIPRSKTDTVGEGDEIGIARGSQVDTCPVRTLHTWLSAAGIRDGPIFRRVTRWGMVGTKRLHPDAVRQILTRRAAAAGIKGTLLEPGHRTGCAPAPSPQPIGTAFRTKKSWVTRGIAA
jgi:integrase